MYRILIASVAVSLGIAGGVLAGPAHVVQAEAQRTGTSGDMGIWRFDVTLRHADTGWDHYANAWRVLDAEGAELGTRTLYHPHVEEQPFTRSLSGVRIPAGTCTVLIEAVDSVHGANSERYSLDLC
ncbi:MAG: hypothetical protein AAFV62_10875 [Pseudomonadota bacterium]